MAANNSPLFVPMRAFAKPLLLRKTFATLSDHASRRTTPGEHLAPLLAAATAIRYLTRCRRPSKPAFAVAWRTICDAGYAELSSPLATAFFLDSQGGTIVPTFGGMMKSPAADYYAQAAQCIEAAQRAPTAETRQAYLDLMEQLIKLADQTAQRGHDPKSTDADLM